MRVLPCRVVLAVCSIGVTAAGSPPDASLLISRIKIDPTAERVFPNAHVSAPCLIISIEGLGRLDGDYSLLDDPNPIAQSRPAWIGTSEDTGRRSLSYHHVQGVWTIGGAHGVSDAYVQVDSSLPPSHSSAWKSYNEESKDFEKVSNAVTISCPACTAASVSTLPGTIAECDGQYRLQTANIKVGVFAWSHVSDERCTMLHDRAGNCVVTMESLAAIAQASSAAAAARGAVISEEWWGNMVRDADMLTSPGGETRIVCTSAGHTTRVVFDLVESQQTRVIPPLNINDADCSVATASSNFKLTSRQNGSIVSSSHSSFHVRLSQAAGLRQIHDKDGDAVSSQLSETSDNLGITTSRRVKITVNGIEAITSLDSVSIHGVRNGTNAFEIFLLESQVDRPGGKAQSVDREVCIAQTVLFIEVFSAETHVVQRRPSQEIMHSSSVTTDGMEDGGDGVEPRRIVFVVDLEVVDGYKLSTLHLLKKMPSGFQGSALDITCAFGDLPVKDLFVRHNVDLSRLCIQPSIETWDLAQRQRTTMAQLLHSALLSASTWEDVTSEHPDVARALLEVYHHMSTFDVLVMPNGAGDSDAFLLQLARLAGVSTRVVNLGTVVSSHMSPLLTGATTLIAPSHYVAHNPAVSRNEGGLSVKVCHPVIDAASILSDARSCRPANGEVSDGSEQATSGRLESTQRNVLKDEGGVVGTKGENDGGLQPARFIMVEQIVPEQAPGMFVRAVAVMQRRWSSVGGRRTEAVVVGNGTLLEYMEGLARDLSASIRFAGFVSADKVPCEVQRATALVVPSIGASAFEMMGPEAMLLGVPVVTFGFGGSGEVVRHMENGILVAEPTPKALADALELLARDTLLRDRLGAQARLDALQALSLPEMVACHVGEFR